jgi:hypothetical protein
MLSKITRLGRQYCLFSPTYVRKSFTNADLKDEERIRLMIKGTKEEQWNGEEML